jgi:hypothetical protein
MIKQLDVLLEKNGIFEMDLIDPTFESSKSTEFCKFSNRLPKLLPKDRNMLRWIFIR